MSPTPEKLPQRLVLFLDGTWNNKDDCTNVLNIFNLVVEGVVGEGASRCVQRKYYDEGVGTGVLDSMSGGMFGQGLEENVREAYNWLVANFNDHGEGATYVADEIYIFGFSRGAYTARSLAGFLARCGLLERGSPLTVSQLWQGYGALEREKQEEDLATLDRWLGRRSFHQLEQLKPDPWPGAENKLLISGEEFTATDELLAIWSRRVRITFIGIFDTVGALGIDALGIPGIRGKLGRIHNMRPSSSYLNFRHALAIDENRNSFQHTPLVEYLPHGEGDREPRKTLKQVWFVGAHSNVGGGYPNNTLAQIPLVWMLREAADVGLVHHEPRQDQSLTAPAALPVPNDSFVDFSGIFGPSFLRQKRNYRTLAPAPEMRAKRGEVDRPLPLPDGQQLASGFSLYSNEVVDKSVWEYAEAHEEYKPPQLIRHAAELCQKAPDCGESVAKVAKRPVAHDWPDLPSGGSPVLVFWALMAGVGFLAIDRFFLLFGERIWVAATVIVVIAALADWSESRLNLRLALGHRPNWERAIFSALFWVRAFMVICFVVGLLGSVGILFAIGWNSRLGNRANPLGIVQSLIGEQGFWLLPAAIAGLLLAKLLDRVFGSPTATVAKKSAKSVSSRLARGLTWLGGILVAAVVAVLAGRIVVRILVQAGIEVERMPTLVGDWDREVAFAGRYLFLLLALAVSLQAFNWVGMPMARANLGRLTLLMAKSRSYIYQALVRWEQLLTKKGEEEHARMAVRNAVRESLFRDVLVLIPIYVSALALAMKLASEMPGSLWLAKELAKGWPIWLVLALVIAVTDLIESGLHLGYLGKKGEFQEPGWLNVAIANTTTVIKFAGFLVAAAVSGAAALGGGFRILWINDGGWRGAVVSVIMISAMVAAASVVLVNLRAFLARRAA